MTKGIARGKLSANILKKHFGKDIELKNTDFEEYLYVYKIYIKGTYFGYIDVKGEMGQRPHIELSPKSNRVFRWEDLTEIVRFHSSYGFIQRFEEVKNELEKEFKWI